ncbi:MAG TPA: hypothetical protein VEK34_03250 [Methylocella sp.]|nr:hypothetical protein [Methylocella sp.]
MTPLTNFTVIAPIVHGKEDELRTLLLTMNQAPAFADPQNSLVPFGEFDGLHFARFVILKDETLGDLEEFYGPEAAFPDAPVYLAFLGDCDGPPDALLADFANLAASGLRQIFSYCEGFDSKCDLLRWMRDHSVRPAAAYVNTIGRTVRQIREEAELTERLAKSLASLSVSNGLDVPPRQIRDELIRAVRDSGAWPTPVPAPVAWQLRRLFFLVAAPLVILLPLLTLGLAAALFVYGAVLLLLGAVLVAFLIPLRRHETTDPDVQKPPKPPSEEHLKLLGERHDFDVTNQYSVMGSFKPGLFSQRLTTVLWWLINFASPILYPSGNLARIKTIHCARWVFLDNKRRGFFASNYDGSYESYMDDFVNKVSFGLNLAFSQGLNYPQTRFLLWGGAQKEQQFKDIQRRHTLPTEVWYKAYPGLTLVDIARNTRIRQGLERQMMTDTEIRQWLAEI